MKEEYIAEYDENDFIIVKTKNVNGKEIPDCDYMMKLYEQCVYNKQGLTHVDFCFEEGEAYKTCCNMERALGLNRPLRPKKSQY